MTGTAKELQLLKTEYKLWDDSKGSDLNVWLGIGDDGFCLASVGDEAPGVAFATSCDSKQAAVGYLTALTRALSTRFGSEECALVLCLSHFLRLAGVHLTGKCSRDWRTIHGAPTAFVADGDRIAVFGRCAWPQKATGKPADVGGAHLWRFRNGKATELTEIFDSARAVAAATP